MDQVLAAGEYEPERPTKSYPKRRLLPQLEEEALKPTLPAYDAADRPPRSRDRAAYQPEVQPAPRRQSNKNTKARGNTQDLRDILENKEGHTRSIYGSRGHALVIGRSMLHVHPCFPICLAGPACYPGPWKFCITGDGVRAGLRPDMPLYLGHEVAGQPHHTLKV